MTLFLTISGIGIIVAVLIDVIITVAFPNPVKGSLRHLCASLVRLPAVKADLALSFQKTVLGRASVLLQTRVRNIQIRE
jgi:hypothetical protein